MINIGAGIICGCLLLTLGCNSGNSTREKIIQTPKNNTKVEFEKLYHDFGEIKSGETVGYYFSFKNIGENPFFIHHVDAGCGCTFVSYPQQNIAPNEKSEIELRFNSTGLYGHQYKSVHVYANIEKKFIELIISAYVTN